MTDCTWTDKFTWYINSKALLLIFLKSGERYSILQTILLFYFTLATKQEHITKKYTLQKIQIKNYVEQMNSLKWITYNKISYKIKCQISSVIFS